MFKDTIVYTDFNGNEQTKELYFHLSSTELLNLEYSVEGMFSNYLNEILANGDQAKMIGIMQDLIKKSYGVKSEDGQRFVKSEEIVNDFLQSEAYNVFFMKMLTDESYSEKFINGILPTNLMNQNGSSNPKSELIQKFKDREANNS